MMSINLDYEDEKRNFFFKGDSIFDYANSDETNNINPQFDLSLLPLNSEIYSHEQDYQNQLIAETSTKTQSQGLFANNKLELLYSPIKEIKEDYHLFMLNPIKYIWDEEENVIEKEKRKIPLFSVQREKKCENRIDYLIKNLKKYSSDCMLRIINEILKKYSFDKLLSKPSSSLYTSVTKISSNIKFMEMAIKDILTLGKNKPNCSRQTKNSKIIENIEKSEIKEIKNFLEMKLKDFYENIFFESKEFKDFCDSNRNKAIDEEFMKENKYSLLEKNGYIRYLYNSSKSSFLQKSNDC